MMLGREALAELSKESVGRFGWTPRVEQAEERPKAEVKRSSHREDLLSKEALDWLYDLSKRPFLQTTVRDRLLALMPGQGKRVREELEEKGYIRRHAVTTGRRGGQLVLEEITEGGFELLAGMQVAAGRPPRKGGYVHKFWQHKVAEWLSRNHEGARTKIEDAGSGKSVDVSLYMPSEPNKRAKAVAFEILVEGEEKEVANVQKDLEGGYDEVFVCVDRWERMGRLREKMTRELEVELMVKVKFELLTHFLD